MEVQSMSSKRDSSGRRVEFAMAVVGAALVLLCAIGLSAPLVGCSTQTGPAIGKLIGAVGHDVEAVFAGLQPKEVADAK